MEKLPPPPRLADRTEIDAALRGLYRRRRIVRRLIRSLESYAQMNRPPQTVRTLLDLPPAGRQVH